MSYLIENNMDTTFITNVFHRVPVSISLAKLRLSSRVSHVKYCKLPVINTLA